MPSILKFLLAVLLFLSFVFLLGKFMFPDIRKLDPMTFDFFMFLTFVAIMLRVSTNVF